MPAPLVPRVSSSSDTSQFQEYEENDAIFKISPNSVYTKEFQDF